MRAPAWIIPALVVACTAAGVGGSKLVVAPSLALHYPFARMFIVNRNARPLHGALTLGLQRAFDDGSLHKLLAEQPGLGPLVLGQRRLPARIVSLAHPWPTRAYRSIPPPWTSRAQSPRRVSRGRWSSASRRWRAPERCSAMASTIASTSPARSLPMPGKETCATPT